ncbi:MAG: DUF2185 domain-containing protein [Maribacter sp.]|nr:DUF2185 domain-containing protein [Maribacter sp.]
MHHKIFKLKPEEIIELIPKLGGCYATDKITVDGIKVGYMYREESSYRNDSGWRFFSGSESQEYVDDASNTAIYDVNTIANYDKTIMPYLNSPIGTELERKGNSEEFIIVS